MPSLFRVRHPRSNLGRRMKTQVTFSFFMALALFPSGTVAPFPKCSPFVFVNKLVESDKVAWLLEGKTEMSF